MYTRMCYKLILIYGDLSFNELNSRIDAGTRNVSSRVAGRIDISICFVIFDVLIYKYGRLSAEKGITVVVMKRQHNQPLIGRENMLPRYYWGLTTK